MSPVVCYPIWLIVSYKDRNLCSQTVTTATLVTNGGFRNGGYKWLPETQGEHLVSKLNICSGRQKEKREILSTSPSHQKSSKRMLITPAWGTERCPTLVPTWRVSLALVMLWFSVPPGPGLLTIQHPYFAFLRKCQGICLTLWDKL